MHKKQQQQNSGSENPVLILLEGDKMASKEGNWSLQQNL